MITQYLKLKYKDLFYKKTMDEMKLESKEEIQKLGSGVPLHKVLGYIEITDLVIHVNNDVLIPRYETEELVLLASKQIKKKHKVLDLCSGSGYIGLAIKNKTGADVTTSDISNVAIEQIKQNANENKLEVNIIQSDLFENINDKFDYIISNPPYIPEGNVLDNSVTDYEPKIALFGGKDGNDFYRKICEQYNDYLKPGGKIFFEMSEDNVEYLTSQGFTIINDINGKPRIAFK